MNEHSRQLGEARVHEDRVQAAIDPRGRCCQELRAVRYRQRSLSASETLTCPDPASFWQGPLTGNELASLQDLCKAICA